MKWVVGGESNILSEILERPYWLNSRGIMRAIANALESSKTKVKRQSIGKHTIKID